MVVASKVLINKKKAAVYRAVRDVVLQATPTTMFQTIFASAVSDPCLQVADYMAWAVQRKYERDDTRSYDLVRSKIATEFQPFRAGTPVHY